MLEVCGGVDSGKSLVLTHLRESYSTCIVGMGELVHELYEPRRPGYRRALELIGGKILAEDGRLNQSAMADYLYRKPSLLSLLGETVHPLVCGRVETLAQSRKERFLVVETVLPARERNHIYSEIWYVFTSRDLRIQHLMASRGYTRGRAAEVTEKQLGDTAYAGMVDWAFVNDTDKTSLCHRIDMRLAGKELRRDL